MDIFSGGHIWGWVNLGGEHILWMDIFWGCAYFGGSEILVIATAHSPWRMFFLKNIYSNIRFHT